MRVLFAWEVGRNFGHVTKLAEVARPLAKRKAELFFALQNPAAIRSFAQGLDYKVFQAPYFPVRPRPGQQRGPSLIYPDDLRPCGYESPADLAGLIMAWQSLYDLIKPDVLVAQAAPTALLAARAYKFKKVTLGAGYDVPPRSSPMPSLRYWENIDNDVIKDHEAFVLNNVNEALSIAGLPKLKTFADLLEVDAEFLTTFEELDHYPDRASLSKNKPDYCGPFYALGSGQAMDWNKNAQKRIFAYLRPEASHFGPCVEALSHLPDDHDVIIAAPGIPVKLQEQLQKPSFRIVNGAVKLDKIIKTCDLGISHGSSGIAAAFALNGVPQLLLPGHIEQMMFARSIGRTKSGRGLAGEFGSREVAELIERLLNEGTFKEAAVNLAEKYKDYNPADLADKIAGEVIKMGSGK
ncbi:MAG: hypothetical protein DHS20C02_00510 [Micavibrio sp.]|nr:MAG: hypothetical protein DHS20C02_00510 [Micavibrio sp.]